MTAPQIITYPSGGLSSSHISDSSSISSGNQLGGISFGYPSANQQLSSRFSSSDVGSSFGLGQYMGESERLARLQAQNIHGQHG